MYLRVSATIVRSCFFLYLAFFQFYGCQNAQKWVFGVKNGSIFPKIDNFAHFGSRKIRKKQNIKKTAPYDCSRDPKVHLYSFLNKLGHFPRTRYNFRRKKNCKIFAESAKKFRFFDQKSAENCRKFLKFWKSI